MNTISTSNRKEFLRPLMSIKSNFLLPAVFIIMNSCLFAQGDGFSASGETTPVRPAQGNTAVGIRFPSAAYTFAFELPAWPQYRLPDGTRFCNEWAETIWRDGLHPSDGWDFETINDRKGVMWMEQRHNARIVVHWRAQLVNSHGETAHTGVNHGAPYGPGEWADEWYYIYPDGVILRKVLIWTGYAATCRPYWWNGPAYETQETFIQQGAGHQPVDDIESTVLTLVKMTGEYKDISYSPYPNTSKSLFAGANIQIVNLKNGYYPFTVVAEGDAEIRPYDGGEAGNPAVLKHTMVPCWPLGKTNFTQGYSAMISHVINWKWHEITSNTVTALYLLGVSTNSLKTERVSKLVSLTRSWQYPPSLNISGTEYQSLGFEMKENAYLIDKKSASPADLHFSIAAGTNHPLCNPAFTIKGLARADVGLLSVKVNGVLVPDVRVGYEDLAGLVVWIPLISETTTEFDFSFKTVRTPR